MSAQAKPKTKQKRRYLSKSDGAIMHKSYADRATPQVFLSEEQITHLYKGQRYDQPYRTS
jgi:hypothetical protein